MIFKALSTILVTTTLALAGNVSSFAASNPIGNNHKTDIRFDWNPDQNKVTITSFTGCRSAHDVPALTSNFEVYLDHDYLQFDIQGGFISHPGEKRKLSKMIQIGPADCMGSRQERLELFIKERETYVINRRGYHVRDIVLGNQAFSFIIADKLLARPDKTKPGKHPPAMFMIME